VHPLRGFAVQFAPEITQLLVEQLDDVEVIEDVNRVAEVWLAAKNLQQVTLTRRN